MRDKVAELVNKLDCSGFLISNGDLFGFLRQHKIHCSNVHGKSPNSKKKSCKTDAGRWKVYAGNAMIILFSTVSTKTLISKDNEYPGLKNREKTFGHRFVVECYSISSNVFCFWVIL